MKDDHSQSLGVFFASCTVILSACAQLLMKYGMLDLANTAHVHLQQISIESIFQPEIQTVILWVFAGLFCYGISMLCWMATLSKYELSLAYPLLSLSYVLVYLGAVLWPAFHESISILRSCGIVLIMIGVILVTRSKTH